jgi:hypothetical protein
MPAEHRAVLVDELDPSYMAPMAALAATAVGALPQRAEVYRGKRALSWADSEDAARDEQTAANRPLFMGAGVEQLLPGVPGLDAALRGGGGRVADVGCGYGWSSIGIAGPTARRAAWRTTLARSILSQLRRLMYLGQRDIGDVQAAGRLPNALAKRLVRRKVTRSLFRLLK